MKAKPIHISLNAEDLEWLRAEAQHWCRPLSGQVTAIIRAARAAQDKADD